MIILSLFQFLLYICGIQKNWISPSLSGKHETSEYTIKYKSIDLIVNTHSKFCREFHSGISNADNIYSIFSVSTSCVTYMFLYLFPIYIERFVSLFVYFYHFLYQGILYPKLYIKLPPASYQDWNFTNHTYSIPVVCFIILVL